VEAASHETASYKKLVKYQDTSKPASRSYFLAEFGGRLRDYDMRLLDATNVKATFFGGRPMNLAFLSNGVEMSKFNELARTKANADFLMVGSATVVAGDVIQATGQLSCLINVELKVYATAGGEMIASAADSTRATGEKIEDCTAVAAQKIARLMAPEFASKTLGYWADRAARGRQYSIELKGSNVSLPMRMAFIKGLREIDGAADIEQKSAGADGVRATLTLKGKGDPMERVYAGVSSQPAFAGKDLDGDVQGELVTLCLGKCGAAQNKKK
jgi:hypothetical protein